MNKYYFHLRIFSNGDQAISNHSLREENNLLALIIDQLGHNAKELKWYKSRIVEAMNKGERVLVSYNTLYVYVNGDTCEIGENDFKPIDFQEVSTELLLNYIDDAIKFREFYSEGMIPGIVPENKEEEWFIVPKEFVKEAYWEVNGDIDEDDL